MTALSDYTTRLLAGTGLTNEAARAAASGLIPASSPAEHALRDGWTAADRATLPPTLPIDTEDDPT